MPRYLLSVIHPPGQVPVTERDFNWQTTRETKWLYGNIATSTKIKTASRLGAPIPVLLWQLKRVNLRLSSFSSNAEGSTRLLCDLCSKFQIFSPRVNHHLRNQGCSMCLQKINLIDTTCLVSNNPSIKHLFYFKSNNSYFRVLMAVTGSLPAK